MRRLCWFSIFPSAWYDCSVLWHTVRVTIDGTSIWGGRVEGIKELPCIAKLVAEKLNMNLG